MAEQNFSEKQRGTVASKEDSSRHFPSVGEETVGKTTPNLDHQTQERSRLERVRAALQEASGKARVATRSAKQALVKAPQKAEELAMRSRESRLRMEEENKKRNFVQRYLSKGVGKWVIKPLIEAIPSPAGYGPGDVITAIGAVRGKDALSGEKLDRVDRVIYGVASVIPGVPATYLVEPTRFLRRHLEDAVYSYKENNASGFTKNIHGVREQTSQIIKAVKESRRK